MILNWILGSFVYCIGRVLILLNVSTFKKDFDLIKLSKYKLKTDLKLPSEFYKFIVLAEDKRFYYHLGFDVFGIVRAFIHNILYGKIEGASTINQQLVRTITNSREKTLKRKLKEIILATQLKILYNKNDIIYHYILIAYLGTNLVGLSSLLKKLNKDLTLLTNIEISEIIARLKYPEPLTGKTEKIILRSNYILKKANQKTTTHNTLYMQSLH